MRSHSHRARYLATGASALLATALLAACGSSPAPARRVVIADT